jgi:hypothetical protein
MGRCAVEHSCFPHLRHTLLVMEPERYLTDLPRIASPRFDRGSTARSLWAVEQRLASTERELRIRFTRNAHLQIEPDLLLAALRRSMDPPVH